MSKFYFLFFFLSWWTLNGAKNWNGLTKIEISVRLVQKANLFSFFGLIAITIATKKETNQGSLLYYCCCIVLSLIATFLLFCLKDKPVELQSHQRTFF